MQNAVIKRTEQERFAPAHLVAGKRADHDGERAGNDQAKRPHGQSECHDGAEDQDGSADRPPIERRPAFQHGVDTSSAPSRPSSTANDFGSIPGPMPPSVPIGRSAPCQKANTATAMTTRPPTKSCRNHVAVGD